MKVKAFDLDTPIDERRVIIRRHGEDVEMVELSWGFQPREVGDRPFTLVRAEGRVFPTHRCLVPASELLHRTNGKQYRFSLSDGDWFYFAGIWRPATRDWPEAYAILTMPANADAAPFMERQMAVLSRDSRMAWLDSKVPVGELLRPLPTGTFKVTPVYGRQGAARAPA
ncbi:SOS response-associated peptidase family protein [Aquabacter sp. CN5-332]|uniref:SOS response-associated peptidase family protein n=1 Tax=Aquabacter sp. CN5-332 TaxID=3156608 RepID=UPI0032B628FE